jgi:hypothetical protein
MCLKAMKAQQIRVQLLFAATRVPLQEQTVRSQQLLQRCNSAANV